MEIKEYVKKIKNDLRSKVSDEWRPQMAIVQVGNNEASNRYIRNKIKDCEEVGAIAHHYHYEETITTEELVWEIEDLAKHYHGLIVQLPIPAHLDKERVLGAIPREKDLDGLGLGGAFRPATPLGILRWLKDDGFEFEGKKAVVIGRSELVGRPMAQMLLDENMTVSVCHSRTKREDLEKLVADADLVVCAVGRANFLDATGLKAVVVDVGINFVDGKLVGDVYGENPRKTPVPGGVGLLTRVALLENLFEAASY